MVDILKIIVSQLNSSVFVLIIILILVIYLAYKSGGLIEKFSSQDKKIDRLESKQDNFVELKTKIDLIYQYTNPNAIAKQQSPIALTEKGRAISQKIHADVIFSRIFDKLNERFQKNKPKNAYDIQASAINVAKSHTLELLNEQELLLIKKIAFEEGIPLDDMWLIFGIMLRNKILTEEGISISEVDKHDNSTPT